MAAGRQFRAAIFRIGGSSPKANDAVHASSKFFISSEIIELRQPAPPSQTPERYRGGKNRFRPHWLPVAKPLHPGFW